LKCLVAEQFFYRYFTFGLWGALLAGLALLHWQRSRNSGSLVMRRIFALLIFCMLVAAGAQASTVTLNFDDPIDGYHYDDPAYATGSPDSFFLGPHFGLGGPSGSGSAGGVIIQDAGEGGAVLWEAPAAYDGTDSTRLGNETGRVRSTWTTSIGIWRASTWEDEHFSLLQFDAYGTVVLRAHENNQTVKIETFVGTGWSTHVLSKEWQGYEALTITNPDFQSITYIDNLVISSVPIPGAVWLFGSALAGLGWMRRRKIS